MPARHRPSSLTRESRRSLIGWTVGWLGMSFARSVLEPASSEPLPLQLEGLLVGVLLFILLHHPTRNLGWIPLGVSLGLLQASCLLLLGPAWWLSLLLPTTSTIVLLGLLWGTIGTWPNESKWMALVVLAGTQAGGVIIGSFLGTQSLEWLGPEIAVWVPVGVLMVCIVVAWSLWVRDGLELLVTLLGLPFYRFQVIGPGAGRLPAHGPLLVIANHAALLDPFWVGKILPRRITPLMTSKYYDLPIISWLMRRVTHTIRVVDSSYRHGAPELVEAIARLDRGQLLLLFPEGWVRRSEDLPLRLFGRGVWHILNERPRTPVVACWIEGSWGSFTSYWNGPPARGKPPDILRRITIILSESFTVPAELLANHLRTRHYLMEQVISLRKYLPESSPEVAMPEFPSSGETE